MCSQIDHHRFALCVVMCFLTPPFQFMVSLVWRYWFDVWKWIWLLVPHWYIYTHVQYLAKSVIRLQIFDAGGFLSPTEQLRYLLVNIFLCFHAPIAVVRVMLLHKFALLEMPLHGVFIHPSHPRSHWYWEWRCKSWNAYGSNLTSRHPKGLTSVSVYGPK